MLEKIQSFLRGKMETQEEPSGPSPARVAATALLVEMSRADFDVTEYEGTAIERAGARLMKTDLETARELIEQARGQAEDSVSLYDFTSLIQDEFSATEKQEVVLELWRVAWSDGSIDPQEEYLVRKVAKLLHVTHDDFIDAKLKARDERSE